MDNINIILSGPGPVNDQGLPLRDDELGITVTSPDPLPDFPTVRTLIRHRFGRTDIPARAKAWYPAGTLDGLWGDLWIVKVETDD